MVLKKLMTGFGVRETAQGSQESIVQIADGAALIGALGVWIELD